jgi:hypothetical protein
MTEMRGDLMVRATRFGATEGGCFMTWACLILAGVFEIAFASTLKLAQVFTRFARSSWRR